MVNQQGKPAPAAAAQHNTNDTKHQHTLATLGHGDSLIVLLSKVTTHMVHVLQVFDRSLQHMHILIVTGACALVAAAVVRCRAEDVSDEWCKSTCAD